MKLRDWLQQIIYKIINPLVILLIKMGVTPNEVTATGCFINIIGVGIFVYGGFTTLGVVYDYNILTWGGLVFLFASLFDMIDGQVARLGNMISTYGALFDSVLDRYSELFTFGGISCYFFMINKPVIALIAFFALVGSLMVSYVRARSEGLGVKCSIGFMQRPERIVLISVGSFLSGIFSCMWILIVCVTFIAIFANITAFARLDYSRREMQKNNKQN